MYFSVLKAMVQKKQKSRKSLFHWFKLLGNSENSKRVGYIIRVV